MADTITLNVNTSVWGVDILVILDSIEGSFTVWRYTPAGRTAVRGMYKTTAVTSINATVDVECPLNLETYYVLEHTMADTSVVTTTSSGLGEGWSTAAAFPRFILRDLFRGLTGIVSDFTFGPLSDIATEYRGGKFAVIGRPDPVIVIDTKASQASQMTLIAKSINTTRELRDLVQAAHPLLIQSPEEYLLGSNGEGVMYFFPDKTNEQHIFPDGRRAERRFVVDYTEIAVPSSAIVFTPPGLTFAELEADYSTFQDLTDTSISFVNLVYGAIFGYV